MVSVDANKKALIGVFKTAGWEWPPQGHPVEVKVHDGPDPKLENAIPYGIHDVGRKAGWVTMGQDYDTATTWCVERHNYAGLTSG